MQANWRVHGPQWSTTVGSFITSMTTSPNFCDLEKVQQVERLIARVANQLWRSWSRLPSLSCRNKPRRTLTAHLHSTSPGISNSSLIHKACSSALVHRSPIRFTGIWYLSFGMLKTSSDSKTRCLTNGCIARHCSTPFPMAGKP